MSQTVCVSAVGNVWNNTITLWLTGNWKTLCLKFGYFCHEHSTFDLNVSAIASLSPSSGGPKHNFRCFFFLFKGAVAHFGSGSWLTLQNLSRSPAVYVSSLCGIGLWWLFLIHMISLDLHRWKEFHPVDDQKSEWVFHPDWSRHSSRW